MAYIHFAWFTFHFSWSGFTVFQGNSPVPGLHIGLETKVVYFRMSCNKKRVTEDEGKMGDT